MAYTVIPDTDIDQDSPITVALMTAIRDNFAGLANGDTGAPRVMTNALNDGSVTEPKLATNSVSNRALASNAVVNVNIAANSVTDSRLLATGATANGRDFVLNRTALAAGNGLGTYIFAVRISGTGVVNLNGLISGSQLRATNVEGTSGASLSTAGSYRVMGRFADSSGNVQSRTSLVLRVA